MTRPGHLYTRTQRRTALTMELKHQPVSHSLTKKGNLVQAEFLVQKIPLRLVHIC